MRLKLAFSLMVSWCGLVLFMDSAQAYPEFLLPTGATRCSECHYSPTGGGLLNDYGRDEAASTLSTDGDGRFFHGLIPLPKQIALGADLRFAALANHVRGSREVAAFPMQGDVYARLSQGPIALSVTAGVLAAIRKPQSTSHRLGVREYYAMYQSKMRNLHVRAGRFYPKAGLRMPDHSAFVRRFTGRYLLEESHAIEAAYNTGENDWNVAIVTPFQPVGPNVGQHGWGATGDWEHFWTDTTLTSVGARGLHSIDGTTGWLTATLSQYFEDADILLQSEANLGTKDLGDQVWIGQLAWYGAMHWKAGSPWAWSVAGHYYDPNLSRHGQERVAIDLSLRHMRKGHFEVSVLLRGEQVAVEHLSNTLMLQGHYFL